ncbi:MAG: hypothetical protein INQ03_23775 [Candidatus Heimdallarchaeota archaeon]|nr:hypothetical protein [Candidatus Heimdallarchaeota archaeon]
MEEIQFPLERYPAMTWLGYLMTGAISGRILVSALLVIGGVFMVNVGFAPISFIFFIIFVLPMAIVFQKRLVIRSKKLMSTVCEILVNDSMLSYKTGFPNTMQPEWQEVKITDKNKNILIKGSADKDKNSGYFLQLSGNAYPEIKLGLWYELEDAWEAAKQLQRVLRGEITQDLKVSEKKSEL